MKPGVLLLALITVSGAMARAEEKGADNKTEKAKQEEMPLISTLKEGERIELWVKSVGCFHDERYFFLFTPGKLVISEVKEDAKGDFTKKELGFLTLTEKEKSDLYGVLLSYRTGKGGGSTTQESFSYELWAGEKLLFKETMNGNGVVDVDWQQKTNVWSLIERVKPKS